METTHATCRSLESKGRGKIDPLGSVKKGKNAVNSTEGKRRLFRKVRVQGEREHQ